MKTQTVNYMIKELSDKIDNLLGIVATKVDISSLNTRLDGIYTRLHDIDTRLDGIDTRLHDIDTRLDGINHTWAVFIKKRTP